MIHLKTEIIHQKQAPAYLSWSKILQAPSSLKKSNEKQINIGSQSFLDWIPKSSDCFSFLGSYSMWVLLWKDPYQRLSVRALHFYSDVFVPPLILFIRASFCTTILLPISILGNPSSWTRSYARDLEIPNICESKHLFSSVKVFHSNLPWRTNGIPL